MNSYTHIIICDEFDDENTMMVVLKMININCSENEDMLVIYAGNGDTDDDDDDGDCFENDVD